MGDAAAVTDLKFRETEAQPQGGGPLHPAGRQLSLQRLHVVLLVQAVPHRAKHEPELQADGFSHASELDVSSGTDAQQRIGKMKVVFDSLCARRERVTGGSA